MRRRLLLGSTVAVALSPDNVRAQQLRTIGILSWFDGPEDNASRFGRFVQELRRLGYEDGRTIHFDFRFAAGSTTKAKQFAEGLVQSKVDLIVAIPTPAALAAKAATTEIPIVFFSADPETSGLVTNLRRPGGNLTGASSLAVDIAAKRVELLRDTIPDLRRIAFLAASRDFNAKMFVEPTERASRSLGIDFKLLMADGAGDLNTAFAEAARLGVQALLVQPLFLANRVELAALGRRYRLPLVCDSRPFAEAGCPVSYGASQEGLYVQMARYVDRILKGAKPGELPVHRATEFELILNRPAANSIGLALPPAVLARADEVIE